MAELIGQIEIESDYSLRGREFMEAEQAQLNAWKAQLQDENDGELVGEVLRWQRADGYAQYMVISESPLQIAHMHIGDAWQVEDALIRGLDLDDVTQMVERERRIKELFSK